MRPSREIRCGSRGHAIVGGPTLQGCGSGTCEPSGARSRSPGRRRWIEPRLSPDRGAAPGEPPIRRVRQAKSPARRRAQCSAWVVLSFLEAVFAAHPGLAQTVPTSSAAVASAPTLPVTMDATDPLAQTSTQPVPGVSVSPVLPWPLVFPGGSVSQAPAISPLTNPAVISPQAQLDYNLQIPLFGELPLRPN